MHNRCTQSQDHSISALSAQFIPHSLGDAYVHSRSQHSRSQPHMVHLQRATPLGRGFEDFETGAFTSFLSCLCRPFPCPSSPPWAAAAAGALAQAAPLLVVASLPAPPACSAHIASKQHTAQHTFVVYPSSTQHSTHLWFTQEACVPAALRSSIAAGGAACGSLLRCDVVGCTIARRATCPRSLERCRCPCTGCTTRVTVAGS